MQPLPYSPACERNKDPILVHLVREFGAASDVLEIGSGTGQHAVHFARALPRLRWWPTDRLEYLPGLEARIAAEGSPNLQSARELDVLSESWPVTAGLDALFTANTLHIMSWEAVRALVTRSARLLRPGESGARGGARSTVAIYGPFRYRDRPFAPSNDAFDVELRLRDPDSGIRDFEAVAQLWHAEGFELMADHDMPANNQLLVFRR